LKIIPIFSLKGIRATGLIIIAIVCLQGCYKQNSDSHSLTLAGIQPARHGTTSMTCKPVRWLPGDSIQILSKSSYDQDGVIEYSPTLSTSFSIIGMEPGLDQSEIIFKLVADSFPPNDNKTPSMKLKGSFDIPELKIGIEVGEMYNILRDSSGSYYFKKDLNYYQIDTFKLD
jgi:hypothetical protein